MSTEGGSGDHGGERNEQEPGWAAPTLPPRAPAPAPGEAPTIPPIAPPEAFQAPPPSVAWPPAPPGAAPPRRRGWLVVLIAVLGVTIVSAIAGTVLFVDRTLPPFDAANNFVNDIIDGHEQSAARRLCSIDRGDSTRAISDVRDTFGSVRATISVNPFSVDRSGDRATVEYTVNASGTRFDHTYKLEVRLEGGDWKACPAVTLR